MDQFVKCQIIKITVLLYNSLHVLNVIHLNDVSIDYVADLLS